MILSEFDSEKIAVINPSTLIEKVDGIPKVAVACYSHITFERMIDGLHVEKIAVSKSANGDISIYKGRYNDTELAFFMITVGAPGSVGILEDVYQMGVESVVVFGNCGVLDKSIEDCGIIIPTSALRDEGISYHYAPPSDEFSVNEEYRELFMDLLDELKIHYVTGKTWTIDAFYRETPEKVARRKAAGCICVEMECSANFAISKFRNKKLLQFFYAGDNLDSEEWDARSISVHSNLEEKDRIAIIALEAAVRISKK